MTNRKIRADKKKDVKPTVPDDLKNCIYSMAFVSDRPVKNVIEEVLINGCYRKNILEDISIYFKRDIRIHDSLYRAAESPESLKRYDGKTARIHTRLRQNFYTELESIAYAIGCPVPTLCTLLLKTTIQDNDFMDDFAEMYISEKLSSDRKIELESISEYVNPGRSGGSFIDKLIDRLVDVAGSTADFVIKKWDEK